MDYEKEIAEYLEKIRHVNEDTRITLFVHFAYQVLGIMMYRCENIVGITHKSGRESNQPNDLMAGRVVLEFKTDMKRSSVIKAETQLREYLSGLIEPGCKAYVPIASDAVKFVLYSYSYTPNDVLTPDDVSLKEEMHIDLETCQINGSQVGVGTVISHLHNMLKDAESDFVQPEEAPTLFQSGSLLYERCIRVLKTVDRRHFDVQFQEWKKYQDVVYGDYSKHADEQSQVDTFLNHTYMATVAKVLAHHLMTGRASTNQEDIITGVAFEKLLIKNFVTEDFFSWIVQADVASEMVEAVQKAALRVQLGRITFDMLRSIYETIEEPANKHLLGASYTPDWLAEMTVVELVGMTKAAIPRILDPACGSGTFLSNAIRILSKILQERGIEGRAALDTVLNCVVGLDVHPVAVLFSKTNYLIVIKKLIGDGMRGDISIPVYMADSIDYPLPKPSPFDSQCFTFKSGRLSLDVPKRVVESAYMDTIIDEIRDVAKNMSEGLDKKPALEGLRHNLERMHLEPMEVDLLLATATNLSELIREGKDTIHAFIFKNIYKPSVIGHFDIVTGNPPWIAYKSFKDSKRSARLKAAVTNEFKLQTKQSLFPGMEIATLFFIKSARDFLKIGGHVGFVMTWAVLNGKQHGPFRAGKYEGVNLKYVKAFDHGEGSNKVSNMFTVESCTLFAKKVNRRVLTRSFPVERFKGRSPGKNASLGEIMKLQNEGKFSIYNDTIRMHETADGNVWNYLKDPGYSKSPYMDAFVQGATIVPHAFWYVEEHDTGIGRSQHKAFVRTSSHVNSKKPWIVQVEGAVERDFLFQTIKSEDIVPFVYMGTRTVVLPVLVESGKFVVLDENGLAGRGYFAMQRYYRRMQQMWLDRKTKKSSQSVSEYINNYGKISNQNPSAKHAVIYNKSGRNYIASCVVNVDKFDRRLVFNTSTYYAYVEEVEAKYICVVLNSRYLFNRVKDIKNARDISRNVFSLGIPKYDSSKRRHSRLVELYDDCYKIIECNMDKITATSIGRKRKLCLELLQDEMKEIDNIVSRII